MGRNRKEIRDHILGKQVRIKKQDIPNGWSVEAADFINQLLQRKPSNRLGLNGPVQVKAHPWFKNFPWQDLYDKRIIPPFKLVSRRRLTPSEQGGQLRPEERDGRLEGRQPRRDAGGR